MEEEKRVIPHVLLFPLPFQASVSCMLKLAELFCLKGFRVTFLNTDYIHRRLLSNTDAQCRFNRYPNLHFATVPDGLPEDNGDQLPILLDSMEAVSKPLFRDIVMKSSSKDENPLSCIIVDSPFVYAVDIAEDVRVSLLFYDTLSPYGFWALISLPKLIEAGDFPFKDDDLDAAVNSIPGMQGFLRRRDLPSFYRANSIDDPIIQAVLKVEPHFRRARGLIFNTFGDLEGHILSQMATYLGQEGYTIGPIHTQLKTRLAETKSQEILSNSIWKEDKNCISWLDQQQPKSVLYISIGSLAVMTKNQLMEIWYGLVKSGVHFLWVQREGSVTKSDDPEDFHDIPEEISEGTRKRGCIVSWVPQEEVLAHRAVGGFLTHSGWNSTLESIVEGVPMICWPYYADQQLLSRYVGEVWRIGLDMKESCDRAIVETMVRDLMVARKEEFVERAEHLVELAKLSVRKGGSSYKGLNRLIEDIKVMSMRKV